jgi:hypothetical protein
MTNTQIIIAGVVVFAVALVAGSAIAINYERTQHNLLVKL